MNWKIFWERQSKESGLDLMRQVGRTTAGGSLSPSILAAIALDIDQKLVLTAGDNLLDVCCGNGALTSILASKCRRAVGIDISQAHIEIAYREFCGTNLRYYQGDAGELSKVVPGVYTKILLYFSFQYFDTFRKGQQAIREMLAVLAPGGSILIGDVPELARLGCYYKSLPRRVAYRLLQFIGRSKMGKFWSYKQIDRICRALNVRATRLAQPTHLPYAHYRCDFLIRRCE